MTRDYRGSSARRLSHGSRDETADPPDGIGLVESIRERTDEIVDGLAADSGERF